MHPSPWTFHPAAPSLPKQRYLERQVWPEVRKLLQKLEKAINQAGRAPDAWRVAQAWLDFWHIEGSSRPAPTHKDLSRDPGCGVSFMAQYWRQREAQREHFHKVVDPFPPALTVAVLLPLIRVLTRKQRRYIRRRYGFDWARNAPLPWKRVEGSPELVDRFKRDLDDFTLLHRMFCTALRVFYDAQVEGPLRNAAMYQETFIAMLNAMYDILEAHLPLLLGHDMDLADESLREAGTFRLAGWARTKTKMFSSLRVVLNTEGDPEHVLSTGLPGSTFQSWHERHWESMPELRTAIISLITGKRSKQRTTSYDPADSSHMDPARLVELDDLYAAWLHRSGLTDKERDVVQLKSEGYSEQEIAETLNRTIGSIKQAWLSARKKTFRPT